MTQAEEIRLIFELDYTNSRSNLKYIEIVDRSLAGGSMRIGNTDTTVPTYYIQYDIYVNDDSGVIAVPKESFGGWFDSAFPASGNLGEFLGTQAAYTQALDVYEFGFYYRDNECDSDNVSRAGFMCTGV